MTGKALVNVCKLWLIWAALVIGFQIFASARFRPQSPDNVLEWTGDETQPGAHDTQPYLLEPFMNQQVAYDSEFYISIALYGYDDLGLRAVWLDPATKPTSIWDKKPLPFGIPSSFPDGRPPGVPENFVAYCLNYAFFPFYPLMMRLFIYPLSLFGLNEIATATLAGVVVSLLGALGAMLALYSLLRERLEHSGAFKAAFYLVAFPTGFFLAMVHTEGLFVGLAFGSLALLKRKKWLWAAILAAGATLTRAVGGALLIPFVLAWIGELRAYLREKPARFDWSLMWKGACALAPLAAYSAWDALLGRQFRAVESAFFSRGTLEFEKSFGVWYDTFRQLFGAKSAGLVDGLVVGILVLTVLLVTRADNREWIAARLPRWSRVLIDAALIAFGMLLVFTWFTNTRNEQRSVYYMVECGATVLALAAAGYMARKEPGIALFSLAVVGISFFSGVAQGMHRYILGAPVIFMMLAEMGEADEVFDRAWTIGSILLMGLFAALFAANFWIG
jgi:hypothetical protein